MKIDSNKLGTSIHWVCRDCGQAALKLPENEGKKQYSLSTWHGGSCDVCKEKKSVTESRDFMYPVFEVGGTSNG